METSLNAPKMYLDNIKIINFDIINAELKSLQQPQQHVEVLLKKPKQKQNRQKQSSQKNYECRARI